MQEEKKEEYVNLNKSQLREIKAMRKRLRAQNLRLVKYSVKRDALGQAFLDFQVAPISG